MGSRKNPTDAEAVTNPVAIVRFLFEKNLPTAETGTDMAVPPRAIPIKTPNWSENQKLFLVLELKNKLLLCKSKMRRQLPYLDQTYLQKIQK